MELTKITTTKPRILSKSFKLIGGGLRKIKGGPLAEGVVEGTTNGVAGTPVHPQAYAPYWRA